MTLERFVAAQADFDNTLILTPYAKQSKKDYQDGINQLQVIESRLKNSLSP